MALDVLALLEFLDGQFPHIEAEEIMRGPGLTRALLFISLALVLTVSPQIGMPGKVSAATLIPYSVAIQNESFNPSPLTVHTGDTAVWTNSDPLIYELYFQYSDGTPIALSPYLKPGDTYAVTFSTPCRIVQYLTVGSTVTITGTVRVLLRGDVNGDGTVNILDVGAVTGRLGANRGDPRYDSASDLNNDGSIDILDVGIVTGYLAHTCQTG